MCNGRERERGETVGIVNRANDTVTLIEIIVLVLLHIPGDTVDQGYRAQSVHGHGKGAALRCAFRRSQFASALQEQPRSLPVDVNQDDTDNWADVANGMQCCSSVEKLKGTRSISEQNGVCLIGFEHLSHAVDDSFNAGFLSS